MYTDLRVGSSAVMMLCEIIRIMARIPIAAVVALSRGLLNVLAGDNVRERLMRGGAEPVGLPPAEFAAKFRAEVARWARVVKSAGIKAD